MAAKKPLLTAIHKKKRLSLSLVSIKKEKTGQLNNSPRCYIWSDESTFEPIPNRRECTGKEKKRRKIPS